MLKWVCAAMLGAAFAVVPAAQAAEPLAPLLELPPDMRAQFQAQVLDGPRGPHRRIDRLISFIFEPGGMGMTYAYEATHTVAESWHTRQANCIGFTLLFVALAREAGFEAWPREIRRTLTWRQDRNIVFRNGHVNAAVRIGAREYSFDVARDAIITSHEPERISDARLLAHYLNSIALDAMTRGELDEADALMKRALAADPAYATHWSNAGVILLRRGDVTSAEAAHLQALALDPRDANALFNLMSLARRNGQSAEEAKYRSRLDKVQRRDALHHFLLALEKERAGDDRAAIDHYLDAIRWHGREPRFHQALAQAYTRIGDHDRAARAQARATRLSDDAR